MAASPGFGYIESLDSGLDFAGNTSRVTVDRGYLDALVRRARVVRSFPPSSHALSSNSKFKHSSQSVDPASITVSQAEYDSLLRISRDYENLRHALIMGGVDTTMLDILVANSNGINDRKDSGLADEKQDSENQESYLQQSQVTTNPAYHTHTFRPSDPAPWREVSYEAFLSRSEVIEQNAGDGPLNERATEVATDSMNTFSGHKSPRTLYFSGLSNQTTYKELFSILKGGKIVSAVLRHDSAIVCFSQGAANFLAWSKCNDIYLRGRRVDVKWAEHEFRFHSHVAAKVAGGATRNLIVHNALSGGLNEHSIRSDMEHISNLVIIDVKYRGGDAYIYTNAINYALFARTCMMSRAAYRGHKIDFFNDECDVPLPLRETKFASEAHSASKKAKKQSIPSIPNRFGVLNMDGTEIDSDEDIENRDPDDSFSENDSISGFPSGFGARLKLSDSDD